MPPASEATTVPLWTVGLGDDRRAQVGADDGGVLVNKVTGTGG